MKRSIPTLTLLAVLLTACAQPTLETEDIPDLTEENIQTINRRHKPTGSKSSGS